MSNSILALQQKLSNHVPEAAAALLVDWIIDEGAHIRIAKSRKTKSGDYRPPQKGQHHQITINHDLNKYEFLFVLIHEFAHLTNTKKCYKKNMTWHDIQPHGKEWKEEFKILMKPFFDLRVFPEDIHQGLINYMQNPAASGCTDHSLQKIFRKYNATKNSDCFLLEDLPDDAHFISSSQRVFKKKKKLRKRFLCEEVVSGKLFYVSALAEVQPIEIPESQNKEKKSPLLSLFNSF